MRNAPVFAVHRLGNTDRWAVITLTGDPQLPAALRTAVWPPWPQLRRRSGDRDELEADAEAAKAALEDAIKALEHREVT